MTAVNLKRAIERRGGTAEIDERGDLYGRLAGYEIRLPVHWAGPNRGVYSVHRIEGCQCQPEADYFCGSFLYRIKDLDWLIEWAAR